MPMIFPKKVIAHRQADHGKAYDGQKDKGCSVKTIDMEEAACPVKTESPDDETEGQSYRQNDRKPDETLFHNIAEFSPDRPDCGAPGW